MAIENGYLEDVILDDGTSLRVDGVKQRRDTPRGKTSAAVAEDDAPYVAEKDPENLIAMHNLTAGNLLHSLKMGGIPVPSLAITRYDTPLTGFGEISLIASPAVIDPQGYAGAKVFAADAYSPRYPSVNYDMDGAWKKLEDRLGDSVDKTDASIRGGSYEDLGS